MAQTVVAYFSASGVTARKAAEIAEATGAELYEIRPASPYTSADLNWQNKKSRSSVEMDDPAIRPALVEDAPDFSGVSTVFLGFPIWWYVEPRIIDTFLDAANLSGVKVVPFATSEAVVFQVQRSAYVSFILQLIGSLEPCSTTRMLLRGPKTWHKGTVLLSYNSVRSCIKME